MPPKRSSTSSGIVEKRKHVTLTLLEKVSILQKLESGSSIRALSAEYGIGTSTIYDVKKQRQKLLNFFAATESNVNKKRKTLKEGKQVEVEKALIQWWRQNRDDGGSISGEMIIEQAKIFHQQLNIQERCEYSNGWLHKFKSRFGISQRRKKTADESPISGNIYRIANIINLQPSTSSSHVEISEKEEIANIINIQPSTSSSHVEISEKEEIANIINIQPSTSSSHVEISEKEEIANIINIQPSTSSSHVEISEKEEYDIEVIKQKITDLEKRKMEIENELKELYAELEEKMAKPIIKIDIKEEELILGD